MKNRIEPFMKSDFTAVVQIIRDARARACQSVNRELVMLYWNIGSFVSRKLEASEWGEDVVGRLSDHLKETVPEMKGFTKRGLYRMKQFFEIYKYHEKVSTLLTQLPWSAHLMLMSRTRSEEEREFYLELAVKNRYTVRELGRQIDSALYERTVLSNQRLPQLLPERHRELAKVFRDSYVFEFLNLSTPFRHSPKIQ
jgi:predicted nuclease of restriction endonuclease-like (RecB) superfamily